MVWNKAVFQRIQAKSRVIKQNMYMYIYSYFVSSVQDSYIRSSLC